MKHLYLLSAVLLLAAGCASKPEYYSPEDPGFVAIGITDRDFSIAAEAMIADMLESGALDKPSGGRYVLAIGRVANRTRRDIDIDQLVKKIRVALLNSKKVVVTDAVGVNSAVGVDSIDPVVSGFGDLANDPNFDPATVPQGGTRVAPELALSGKIIEKVIIISSSKKGIEYTFQLSITDLKTGLAFWEGEKVIGKIGKR